MSDGIAEDGTLLFVGYIEYLNQVLDKYIEDGGSMSKLRVGFDVDGVYKYPPAVRQDVFTDVNGEQQDVIMLNKFIPLQDQQQMELE